MSDSYDAEMTNVDVGREMDGVEEEENLDKARFWAWPAILFYPVPLIGLLLLALGKELGDPLATPLYYIGIISWGSIFVWGVLVFVSYRIIQQNISSRRWDMTWWMWTVIHPFLGIITVAVFIVKLSNHNLLPWH